MLRCSPAPGPQHVRSLDRLFTPASGAVRLMRTRLQNARKPRLSGRKLAPLEQGSGAALLANVAAVEVAVQIEVSVDRGVNGSKLL
jgi:hypothetical protein